MKTLEIELATDSGAVQGFSLRDPVEGLTLATVSAWAEKCIENHAVLAKGEPVTKLKSAFVKSVEVTALA